MQAHSGLTHYFSWCKPPAWRPWLHQDICKLFCEGGIEGERENERERKREHERKREREREETEGGAKEAGKRYCEPNICCCQAQLTETIAIRKAMHMQLPKHFTVTSLSKAFYRNLFLLAFPKHLAVTMFVKVLLLLPQF